MLHEVTFYLDYYLAEQNFQICWSGNDQEGYSEDGVDSKKDWILTILLGRRGAGGKDFQNW